MYDDLSGMHNGSNPDAYLTHEQMLDSIGTLWKAAVMNVISGYFEELRSSEFFGIDFMDLWSEALIRLDDEQPLGFAESVGATDASNDMWQKWCDRMTHRIDDHRLRLIVGDMPERLQRFVDMLADCRQQISSDVMCMNAANDRMALCQAYALGRQHAAEPLHDDISPRDS